MSELSSVGRAAVTSGFSGPEETRSPADRTHQLVDAEPAQLGATSPAAALEKKHTFDCAQPTRGGLCNC
jgi:hypothetical protein